MGKVWFLTVASTGIASNTVIGGSLSTQSVDLEDIEQVNLFFVSRLDRLADSKFSQHLLVTVFHSEPTFCDLCFP